MSADKRSFFSKIFVALMIFTGLVWAWTVAFIISWPWDKTSDWKPEFRLIATCVKDQQKEACGVAYGELAAARAAGQFESLTPPEAAGDLDEIKNWLKWKVENGLFEVKSSSWHFQTTVRYRLENDVPVLVEYQDIEAKAFYYGVAAALFSLLGIYLRKLRG